MMLLTLFSVLFDPMLEAVGPENFADVLHDKVALDEIDVGEESVSLARRGLGADVGVFATLEALVGAGVPAGAATAALDHQEAVETFVAAADFAVFDLFGRRQVQVFHMVIT